MAAINKQKLKLLHLMKMLYKETDAEHGLSMSAIIANLEKIGIDAERKSIYRDLAALREFGMDIKTINRSPVEYALVRNRLGFDELMLLIDAVQGCPAISESKSKALVKGIKDLASDGERKRLNKRIHVCDRIKTQSESVFYNIDTIHAAMLEKRKVQFLYYKYDLDLQREIQHGGEPYVHTPVQVVFSDGQYYLITWSDSNESFVTFRIDRIRLLQVSGIPATKNERIANFDADKFVSQAFGMYQGEEKTVTLKVRKGAMDVVVDRFGKDIDRTGICEDSVDVHVKVIVSSQFFGWIAGMNGSITIASPGSVVQEYMNWLKSLLEG